MLVSYVTCFLFCFRQVNPPSLEVPYMHKASAGYDKESSIEYVHDYPDHTDLQSPSAINCECEHVAVTGD